MPKNERTLLGFDFGMKRIGVAVGQTLTGTANPLRTLKAEQGKPNWSEIKELVKEWGADACVVGKPFNMDNSDSWITEAVQQFAQLLEENTHLPVYLVDERLTTKSARQIVHEHPTIKRKAYQGVDDYCAALILETYMRS